ncbi:phage portal protein [Pelagibius sp.]|uniref:phage portal protein n=1 Tax=Pelagibius sp. TaxID=1931238 RepID=UPI00262C8FC3|nr:phage portal protein [Pelagibius sp.]
MAKTKKLPTRSLLDRAIAAISPSAGVRRVRAKAALHRYDQVASGGWGGYGGADRRKRSLKRWNAPDGSADSVIAPDLVELRRASLDLDRNMPLATGAFQTIASSVVGTGLTLQSRLDRDFLRLTEEEASVKQREIERLWRHLAKRADWRRQVHLGVLEYVALYSCLASGDCFALLPMARRPGDLFGLKVQLIEAGRVCNRDHVADGPTLVQGIVLSDDGRPLAAHIANKHPFDFGAGVPIEAKWETVPFYGSGSGRRNLLHIFDPTRPDQTRGVPILAPVIEELKQLSDYSGAELMAAVVNSCFSVIAKTDDGEGMAADPGQIQDAKGLERWEVTFEPGMVLEGLSPNETIESFTPGRPNPQFEAFFTAVVRQIAVAIGLSFEVLIRHFTASYSASRASLLETWKMLRRRRALLVSMLHQPLYEEMLAEAVDSGLIGLPGWEDPLVRDAWCSAEWTGPSPGQIDPKKEVDAARERVDMGVSTLQRETAEMTGGDWESNHAQRSRERAARVRDGLEGAAVQAGAAPVPAADEEGDRGMDRPEDETQEEN